MKYQSIFISDLHLGSSLVQTQTQMLFQLLESVEAKKIFLIGDIVDITCSSTHPDLILFIELLHQKSWEIIYIEGNHEEYRGGSPVSLSFDGGLFSMDEYIYKGDDCLVYLGHGHSFDRKSLFNKFLRKISKSVQPKDRKKRKKNSFYQKYMKPLGQIVLEKPFKRHMVSLAKSKKCKVVISGHFHIPRDEQIGDVHYLNCGDWIKNNTYIVEREDGEFLLLEYIQGCDCHRTD